MNQKNGQKQGGLVVVNALAKRTKKVRKGEGLEKGRGVFSSSVGPEWYCVNTRHMFPESEMAEIVPGVGAGILFDSFGEFLHASSHRGAFFCGAFPY
jgi:hypothetical protein